MCVTHLLTPLYLLWSCPLTPIPLAGHTNVQVADMESLLLRELTEDIAAGRAQSPQRTHGATSKGQDLFSHRIAQGIPGAAWPPVPKSIQAGAHALMR